MAARMRAASENRLPNAAEDAPGGCPAGAAWPPRPPRPNMADAEEKSPLRPPVPKTGPLAGGRCPEAGEEEEEEEEEEENEEEKEEENVPGAGDDDRWPLLLLLLLLLLFLLLLLLLLLRSPLFRPAPKTRLKSEAMWVFEKDYTRYVTTVYIQYYNVYPGTMVWIVQYSTVQ